MTKASLGLVFALLCGAGLSLTACRKRQADATATPSPSGGEAPKAAPAMPGVNVEAIKVDTVGYPVGWQKVAILNFEPAEVHLEAADAPGVAVFTVDPSRFEAKGIDAASQDPVWQVDFSAFDTPGRYRLVSGKERSVEFSIGAGVYRRALVAAQKHFYFQRTRTALVAPYAEWEGTSYLRPEPSHVHEDVGWDLLDYPEKKRKWKVEGGWHDAGNYDMYVPSTAPTAQALLMAYEARPELFVDGDLNVPESGNGVPDLLDEVRWGLDWILSVQEPETGAFRHREAVMQWSPDLPAHKDRTVRWIAGPSTSATGKAVAVLALAARLYRPFDAEYAARAEASARKGWEYLLAHPEHVRVDGKGSPQPLWDDEPGRTDTGARFVAAAEMWRSFRLEAALEQVRSLLATEEAKATSIAHGAWVNLSRWALLRLATDEETPEELRSEAKARILTAALGLLPQVEEHDGYRCASTPTDYYWGHNSNLMEKAHLLYAAAGLTFPETAKMTPDDSGPDPARLVKAARDQWHWILGRNPNGYSMVTRVGKGPDRMYHMEWGHAEPPPPGFLVGGPNAVEMAFLAPGAPAKALLWDNPKPLRSGLPPHSLWHWQQSDLWDGGFVPENEWTNGWWAVTEPDIYYNANLVLVATFMQD